MIHTLSFDVAHLLAGGLVLVSLMMLYQTRLTALLHVLGLHADAPAGRSVDVLEYAFSMYLTCL